MLVCIVAGLVVVYLLVLKPIHVKRGSYTEPEPADTIDLKTASWNPPSKSPLPAMHGPIISVLSRIAHSLIGLHLVVPSMFNIVKLPEFRTRKIPEHPTYFVKYDGYDEPRCKADDKTEGLQEYYTEVVRKSKVSKINELLTSYENGSKNPITVVQNILSILADDKTCSVTQFKESEMKRQAKESAERIRNKQARHLEGVPFVVKENIATGGYERRGGLPITVPVQKDSAHMVQNLLDQGAIFCGVANMHQIGIGVSGVNTSRWHKGGAKNPWDLRHFTGGSSSGTASAVSSGLVVFGVGNDGGGSVRIPAASCGIVGIKATYGRVSLHGDSSDGTTVTHAGPLATCVEDCTFVYGIMCSKGGLSVKAKVQVPQPIPRIHSKFGEGAAKVGFWADWINMSDSQTMGPFMEAMDKLKSSKVIDVNENIRIPEMDWARTAHLCTILSEMAQANRYLVTNHRHEICNDTSLYLAGGGWVKAADYILSAKQKQRMMVILERVFKEFDVDFIITPTMGCLPGARQPGDEKYMFMDNDYSVQQMTFVTIGNLVGIPAITVPVGHSKSPVTGATMPVSLQIYAPWWNEDKMCQLASRVQNTVGMLTAKPKVQYSI